MPFIPLHDTTPRTLIARPWTTWALIAVTALAYAGQASGGAEAFMRLIYVLGAIPAALTGRAELAPALVMADPLATLLSSQRSEERRDGHERVSPVKSPWLSVHLKTK